MFKSSKNRAFHKYELRHLVCTSLRLFTKEVMLVVMIIFYYVDPTKIWVAVMIHLIACFFNFAWETCGTNHVQVFFNAYVRFIKLVRVMFYLQAVIYLNDINTTEGSSKFNAIYNLWPTAILAVVITPFYMLFLFYSTVYICKTICCKKTPNGFSILIVFWIHMACTCSALFWGYVLFGVKDYFIDDDSYMLFLG